MSEVENAKNKPFVWGSHDCLTWACNVILAMTGHDYLKDFRNGYTSKKGAYRLIKKYGESLPGCIDRHLERIPVSFAKRGDLVLQEQAIGVCLGIQSLFVTEAHGLQGLQTLGCEIAWRVP